MNTFARKTAVYNGYKKILKTLKIRINRENPCYNGV